MTPRRANTKQMLADCLNKECQSAGDDLLSVSKSDKYQLSEDTMADRRSMAERARARRRRQDYLRQKYPYHKRPAEHEHLLECTTFFEDAVAQVIFDPIRLGKSTRWGIPWRFTCGQRAGDNGMCSVVEEMLAWGRLGEKCANAASGLASFLASVSFPSFHTPTRRPLEPWTPDVLRCREIDDNVDNDDDDDTVHLDQPHMKASHLVKPGCPEKDDQDAKFASDVGQPCIGGVISLEHDAGRVPQARHARR